MYLNYFIFIILFFQAHAKALETRNAQLVSKNERPIAQNKQFCSDAKTKGGQDLNSLPGDSL